MARAGTCGLPSVEEWELLLLRRRCANNLHVQGLGPGKSTRFGAAGWEGGPSTPSGSTPLLCASGQARYVDLDAGLHWQLWTTNKTHNEHSFKPAFFLLRAKNTFEKV